MLIDLIDDARARGARLIEVGHRPGDATRRPHTLAPTVVLGVADEMKIAHEDLASVRVVVAEVVERVCA